MFGAWASGEQKGNCYDLGASGFRGLKFRDPNAQNRVWGVKQT